MSKISTYEVAPVPKLADKLIGTSVGGEIEDVTYNFTLQELLDVFLPVIPANNLQGVLDYGNTATQDINLFGTITTTNLEVTDTANFLDSYLVGDTHIQGGLFDSEDSIGLAGQVLTSTGDFVEWVTLPPIFTPNLQQVLEEGNTSTIGIILDAGLEALDVNTDTATINTNITIDGTITDGDAGVGAAGNVLSSTATGVKWVALPVYSATSPLLFNSATGVFSIQQATNAQNGYLSSTDWITFNGKQNAGNYITALTGEVTASGPGSATATVSNAAVIGKVLTGFNPTAGTINASDSILTAFGKTQSQINALVGGVQYQGVWNASTNVPTLTSSVGVQGHYYVVNVAGNTNLNGITDWQIGDWAIFSESTWQKVDNTESVSSVNGFTGAVELTTDNIPEGTTNLYFLNSRARLALSATSPLGYDNSTGVFSIQQANISQNGYLSSTDWNTFNDKQNYLGGTGLVKSSSGTISYITDNSTNWNTAYDNMIVSAAVTGTTNKTLTLTQQDAGTITASWIDLGLTSVGLSMPLAFNVANSPLTANGTIAVTAAGVASQYIRGDGTLANFPTNGGGGGGSVSYYLNGSVNQGTFGGNTYYEMSKTPIIGAGTDFSINANGYIAQFITDAGDPALLNIPAGNWNFEMYFSASSGGGTPSFYVELYKYDGVVFTLISSNSATPEAITGGTAIDLYTTAVAVPSTVLTLTDRLAIRVYVTHSGRTITLHTEDNHLCQVITTFSTGITALNGLTEQVQYFQTGTSGTDFNISSATDTHTFNLPVASATNTGKLSSTDWSTFNNKTSNLGTVTSVAALTLGTTGTDLSSTVADSTTTPVITLNVPTASAANRGALSATDWSTFNTKVSSVTASSPLASSGGSTPNITIQQSSGSQDGYLSSTDWTTFNSKQAAGNYITSLTGEATASGPGAAAVTLNNASVTGKVLTGVNITGGTVQATDTMLTAFGKLQNQINGLIGSTIYQGTWNASTNTPALASGVGVRGYYYIVSVAGTTNLDGISDWFVGDWAIFDGTAWQQVDNTDAVVSVNGQTGAVSLTTDNVPEGATNQYFLNSRARAALSFTAGSGAYNSTTGVITIPTNTSQLTNGANFITLASLSGTAPIQYNNTTGAISITQSGTASNGFLSSTDWNTFNNKQAGSANLTSLSGLTFASTSFVKMTAAGTFALDTNTYALASALGNYLPLTGGTLTGDLTITKATVTANIVNATDTSSFSYFGNQENGTLRTYFLYLNSLWTDVDRRNNLEIRNQNGPITFWANANKALSIANSGATTISSAGGYGAGLIIQNTNAAVNNFSVLTLQANTDGYPIIEFKEGANQKWQIFNEHTNDSLDFYKMGVGAGSVLNLAASGAATFASSIDILGGSLTSTNGLHQWFNTSTNQAWIQAFQSGVDWRQINYNGAVHNFLINDVTTLYVSNSRNVGIGVIPSAWSGFTVLQVKNQAIWAATGDDYVNYSSNAYFDGTNSKYISTQTATLYQMYRGGFGWYSAASGTANTNINWGNPKMIFTSAGNLGIGTADPSGSYGKLSVAGGISLLNDSSAKLQIGRFSSGIPNSYIKIGANSNSLRITNATDTVDLFYFQNLGSFGISTDNPVNTAWGNATDTKQLSIVGTTYGVINLTGGTGGTLKTYSMGVGDGNFYMCYDNTLAVHGITMNSGNILIKTTGGITGGGALQVNGNVNINGVFQINGVTIGGGGGSGVTGSGTTNFITKWTGSTTLGNSIIQDNGTNVGIGFQGGARLYVGNAANNTAPDVSQIAQFQTPRTTIGYPLTLSIEGTPVTGDQIRMSFNYGSTYSSTAYIASYLDNATTAQTGLTFGTYNGGLIQSMRLTATGNLLINRITDEGYQLDVNGTGRFTGNLTAASITSASTITASNSITASGFFDTSDSRLKIIIKDYNKAKGIEKVQARFYLKNNKKELGYFAQDIQEILPSAVAEGADGFLTLSYSQVHTAKIAVIESEIDILKNKVSELEFKLQKYEL